MVLTSSQNLAALEDPHHPGQFLVLNKARINLDVPEVRWGFYLEPDSWTPEAARKAEALNEVGRPHAATCLAASREVGQPLSRTLDVPRQIHSQQLDSSLHQEAKELLKTQALALIHHQKIAELLGQPSDGLLS